jgi:hypothetical protein
MTSQSQATSVDLLIRADLLTEMNPMIDNMTQLILSQSEFKKYFEYKSVFFNFLGEK